MFNVYERAFQRDLEQAIAPFGKTFLPQRDCPQDRPELIFSACVEGVRGSRIVVANLSGVDVDSGTAFEVGFAYALGKPIYGIRSEMEICLPDRVIAPNLMLKDAANIFATVSELAIALREERDGV
ncbi:MAG: nucleoside 2-deoxyribosyltransferase [Cyanobacteria bacterium J06642_2]